MGRKSQTWAPLSQYYLTHTTLLCFTCFSSQLIVTHLCSSSYVCNSLPCFTLAKNGLFMFYTVKKASHFSVPSRDVTYQTLPIIFLQCGKKFNSAYKKKPHAEKVYNTELKRQRDAVRINCFAKNLVFSSQINF